MLCNRFSRLKWDLDVLERYEEEKNHFFSEFSWKDCLTWHPAWPLLKRPFAPTLKSRSSRWLESSFTYTRDVSQPSECGRQRTLNSVHGHTAARLQSNGNLAVWMSQISTEWRECSIMTLSTIHWVPVQDKGSKILCGKLGAMKITPSDCLHQEYLTINLGSTSDWQQLKLPLVRLFGRWRGRCWPAGAAFQTLLQPVRMGHP